MKLAKALVLAALLVPSVASAQGTQEEQQNPRPLLLVPTNFVFLAPIITSFIAVPVFLGRNNDAQSTPTTN